ncbi:MAG: stage V sporulation protein AD, partial [Clostridia bacterium]|nr:stage V sporulation protein AD [Clostridia bacterium]
MKNKRMGKATVKLQNPVHIVEAACIAGTKEGKGPLSSYYDEILTDDLYDEKTWERAESKLQKNTLQKLISKSGKSMQDVDYVFAGDLLNQCCGTHYALSDTGIPFFGLYGACSTMAESLSLAAMLV